MNQNQKKNSEKIKDTLKETITNTICSYSSILFSQNRVVGYILIIASMMSPRAGCFGLVSATIVNILGKTLHLNEYNLRAGYYGFNAALTGMAIGTIFPLGRFSIFVLFASTLMILMICIITEGFLKKYYLPYLSIPFLVALWTVMLSNQQTDDLSGFGILNTQPYEIGAHLKALSACIESHLGPMVKEYLLSLSYVFFQDNLLTGILIAAAILIYSRIAFVYSSINFMTAYLLYLTIDGQIYNLPFHFYGFNFLFTSIAIGCFYVIPSLRSLLWSIILLPVEFLCIYASSRLLNYVYLPTYSLSFCITSLLVLYMLKQRQSKIWPDPAINIEKSPEKSLYNSRVNSQRLKNWQYVPIGLPFLGSWTITQGYDGQYTHKGKWRHALDFSIEDKDGKQYEKDGEAPEDYYCYGKPVTAPADGIVAAYKDSIEDNAIGERNKENNWGNYIAIKHKDGLYSMLCHLKKDSVCVNLGQNVLRGQRVGLCGNSGNSPYPHLHMQMQTTDQPGWPTTPYPLSEIEERETGTTKFITCDIPQEGAVVENVNTSDLLRNVFNLPDYRKFQATTNGRTEELEFDADEYGTCYIKNQNGDKAWYGLNRTFFSFIRYEGEKKGFLYNLYLACYKVVLEDTKQWNVEDKISVDNMTPDLKKMWSDVTAYVKESYSINYNAHIEKKDGKTTIRSEVISKFFGQRRTERESRFEIEDKNHYRLITTGPKIQREETSICVARY